MKEGELGRVYSNGEAICTEGETGDKMFVIQSGRVKITKNKPSGEITLATLGSGDMFGEMALFDKLPRSATATAMGESRVLGVDKKKLFITISRDPTLAFKILETMSQRIRRLNDDLTKLTKDKLDVFHVCMDFDATCSLILEEARNIISCEHCSIMLFDEAEKSLSIKAAFGSESDLKVRLSAGEGIAGDVFKSGKAELINNVAVDPRYVPGKMQIKSILCVPLQCQDRIIGVLNMSNTSERLFNLNDLNLLRSLSIYASIAVQHSKNFTSVERAANEMLSHVTII